MSDAYTKAMQAKLADQKALIAALEENGQDTVAQTNVMKGYAATIGAIPGAPPLHPPLQPPPGR